MHVAEKAVVRVVRSIVAHVAGDMTVHVIEITAVQGTWWCI